MVPAGTEIRVDVAEGKIVVPVRVGFSHADSSAIEGFGASEPWVHIVARRTEWRAQC